MLPKIISRPESFVTEVAGDDDSFEVVVAKFPINASGANWWPNFLLMHVTPSGGQILY